MANAQSTCNVFVYSSLQADVVVRVLLNRVPPSSPTALHHYQRFSIKGRVYPAILPVERSKVNGSLLWGITLPELEILDNFKDVEYERRNVDVSLMDSSELKCFRLIRMLGIMRLIQTCTGSGTLRNGRICTWKILSE
ncbi:unnamed protein product [Cuscuta epithymum]|uniref:Putative gamma-glutamylcyclotransferase n=1 Tax=Cuscuta epithymum TaxID=186058 RepID=A0AAV0DKR3_9ASTE|nr:unnamed protein product [Cuscuta epithymum]